jgi:ketosteroid isomerase-like protein
MLWMNMREWRLHKQADDEREQNKALIQRYFSAYDTGDSEHIAQDRSE